MLSLQKATLIPGGSESLVYTTISGRVGMLVPFTSREVLKMSLPSRHLLRLHLARGGEILTFHWGTHPQKTRL